ncbi:potassium-transporting ATPase subunit KdpA, partial [Alicyclobacillus tolerans]|uniref:potassium-transporting ATPase subunit KdpA n=1 Tax=Alicyclobacillus tolerans TaxID=90970 RepID=UPI001F2CF432
MTFAGTIGILVVVALILLLAIPLGGYIYRVFTGQRNWLEPIYAPVERVIYKLVGINPAAEMDWKSYVKTWLLVQFIMAIFVYLIFVFQGVLPLNPDHIKGMSWDLAFNTAASFITNTNWQNYAGEQSMSYLGQMIAITYLQFTSAAAGVVAVIAFVRSIVANKGKTLGNFWVDYVKVHTRILLPLA